MNLDWTLSTRTNNLLKKPVSSKIKMCFSLEVSEGGLENLFELKNIF